MRLLPLAGLHKACSRHPGSHVPTRRQARRIDLHQPGVNYMPRTTQAIACVSSADLRGRPRGRSLLTTATTTTLVSARMRAGSTDDAWRYDAWKTTKEIMFTAMVARVCVWCGRRQVLPRERPRRAKRVYSQGSCSSFLLLNKCVIPKIAPNAARGPSYSSLDLAAPYHPTPRRYSFSASGTGGRTAGAVGGGVGHALRLVTSTSDMAGQADGVQK